VQPPKVQPSSLVFVAIVASWAAYLLPRWVVRRDSLGQARGRDRHSAQLRVLARRRRRPAGPSSAPLLTAGRTAHPATPPRHIAASPSSPASPAARTSAARPSVARSSAARRASARRAALRRARVLGLLIVATMASVALATLTPAPIWMPAPAATLLVLDLVALVVSGRRRAAARRAVAREVALRTLAAGHRVEAARKAAPAAGTANRPAGSSARSASGSVAGAGRADRVVATASGTRAGSEPGRVAAVAIVGQDGAGHEAADRDGAGHDGAGHDGAGHDGARRTASRLVPVPPLRTAASSPSSAGVSGGPGWTPVAVPPPTYTLKPVARRAEPRALDLTPPAAPQPAPRPWDIDPVTERPWADELDLDLVLARRRAVNG